MASSTTRTTKQLLSSYCFKDKEKAITNIYLQHHVRAQPNEGTWWATEHVSVSSHLGKSREMWRKVHRSSYHQSYPEFSRIHGCWLRPKASFEYLLTWHMQVRSWSVIK